MDAFTFVPPWPFYSHIAKSIQLTASDRVPIENFGNFGSSTPTFGAGYALPFRSLVLGDNWRFGLQRAALYVSLLLPGNWGVRLIVQLMPIVGEGLVRSLFHHKSARYLGLFPTTEVRRAMGVTNP